MKKRKIRNGIFEFPDEWIELNPQEARKSTAVNICTSNQLVGIYYSNTPTYKMEDWQIEKIREKAIKKKFNSSKLNYWGIIDPLYPGIKNVGNARIIHYNDKKGE